MAPASPLLATAIIKVDIRFIQRRSVTIRLQVFFTVIYFLRETSGSQRVHFLWREVIWRLCPVAYNILIRLVPVSVYFALLERGLHSLVTDQSFHLYRKDRGISCADQYVTCNVCLRPEFLSCSFYGTLEGRSLNGPGG